MIRLIRSVKALSPLAASEFVAELTEHVSKNHDQVHIEAFVDRFADGGRTIYWHIDFKDLEHFEKWQGRLAKDQAYISFLSRASEVGLFVEGTMKDSVQHKVSVAVATSTLR